MNLCFNLALNGSDYFLYALDERLRKATGRGNACSLAMELDAQLSPEKVQKRLDSIPALSALGALRLVKVFPGSVPRWRSCLESSALTLKLSPNTLNWERGQLNDFADIHPRRQAPLRFDLISGPHSSTLLFTWHHALMDANGAEELLRVIGASSEAWDDTHLLPKNSSLPSALNISAGFFKRLKIHREARRIIFDSAKKPVALIGGSGAKPGGSAYRLVRFDLDQTKHIDRNCEGLGAALFKSSVYLAASARALRRILQDRGVAPADFHLPVPHNLRKLGAASPIISNHITFLFFRIPSAVLGELKHCVHYIIADLQRMVQQREHLTCTTFLHDMRHLPRQIYLSLVDKPTAGNLASFFFSDRGEALNRLDSFMGGKITRIAHFPPNTHPPGFTVVFSRWKGCLIASISYSKGIISEAELGRFEELLRSDLLSV